MGFEADDDFVALHQQTAVQRAVVFEIDGGFNDSFSGGKCGHIKCPPLKMEGCENENQSLTANDAPY